MNKSIIPWLAILLVCILYLHHQRENKHQLAFDRVKAMAQVDPASIDISQASSACQDYLKEYPQRRESGDVRHWLGDIEKEKARRAEAIRLAKVEQQRQLAEAGRMTEQERIANLPENLFAKAKNLLGSNDHDAIPLLEKASQKGSAAASFELAHIYAKGLCGKKADEQSMVNWLSKAEAQGHSRAGEMLRQRKEQTEWLTYLSERYNTIGDSWGDIATPDPSSISPDELKRGISELTAALRGYKIATSYSKKSAQDCLNNLLVISRNGGATGSESSAAYQKPQLQNQSRASNISPGGNPPRWQVQQGQTRPDGVRTFNENQYIASHYGRFGGAYSTPREARLKAEALNTQQGYNLEAMQEQSMYSGRNTVVVGNFRVGRWRSGYDENLNAFVVYQE